MIRVLIFLLCFTFSAHAQVDYLKYKDQINFTCRMDSAWIVDNQILIDSLDTMQIVNGKSEFLKDKGWVYYMRYLKWDDLNDLKIAAINFEKAWNQFRDLRALWILGHIYRPLGDCDKSLELTELYLKEVPDSIQVDYKKVYYRYKFCRNKE